MKSLMSDEYFRVGVPDAESACRGTVLPAMSDVVDVVDVGRALCRSRPENLVMAAPAVCGNCCHPHRIFGAFDIFDPLVSSATWKIPEVNGGLKRKSPEIYCNGKSRKKHGGFMRFFP